MLLNIAILLSDMNSFIFTQLNGFMHRYVTQTIRFRHIIKEFQVLLINPNNSIQHYSFVTTQLNGSKYCNVSQTIQLNINHLFTLS